MNLLDKELIEKSYNILNNSKLEFEKKLISTKKNSRYSDFLGRNSNCLIQSKPIPGKSKYLKVMD